MKSLHVFLLIALTALQFSCKSFSQKKGTTDSHEASIAFYNVENLFDTINDPLINDEEFLPDGRNEWNSQRYNEKIDHINKVFDLFQNPLLIGLAEIENAQVVRDVMKASSHAETFGLVHFQSTDARGIDVALIYDSSRLELKNSGFIRFDLTDENGEIDHTRDILWAEFKTGKETLFAMVNHWPSRRGGQEASDSKRVLAAQNARKFIDSLLNEHDDAQIVFMGDLNDYPENNAPKLIAEKLVPMITKSSGQYAGSYNYRGEWDVLDHILVSEGFLAEKKMFVEKDSGKILSPEFIMETYKGDIVPFRAYAGSKYLGGYSDHLPVCISVHMP